MKEYILRREKILHFFSLLFIAGSVFTKEVQYKIYLVLTGVAILFILSVFKGHKITSIIYGVLLVIAVIASYYIMKTYPMGL